VPAKTYDQYCGIAAALDRVGDRWTLLVLRELSFGPRRFTDLRTGLRGIASNLLADRLKDLEGHGLVEQRELPPPAARTVYALTQEGRRVLPVLRALALFGLPFLDEPADGGVRPTMAVRGAFVPLVGAGSTPGVDLRLVLRIGDEEEHVLEVADGVLVRPREGAAPEVVVTGSAADLVRWCRGASLADLGELTVEGPASARRVLEQVLEAGRAAARA
jgi:DNA-binding HxlR family transcriptional regulator